MSKLLDVVAQLDFDLLHSQAEAIIEVIAKLQEEQALIESDTNDQNDIDYLQEKIDHLTGVVEFLDSIMIAAADDGEWVDPTRPEDLDTY